MNSQSFKDLHRPVTVIDNYSKTCVKWPLKNRQNKDLNDKWLRNEGQSISAAVWVHLHGIPKFWKQTLKKPV